MYYAIGIDADIAGKKFTRLNSLRIETDINKIGSVATLTMPTTARLRRKEEVLTEVETSKTFQVGDQVVLRIGYDDNLREEFRGYIRRIHPTTPLRIDCEDEVFNLRRKNLQRSFGATTLEELLQFIIADTAIDLVGEIPVINFEKFYFKNVNAALALRKLKDKYGLVIYFREPGKLFVGLASDTDDRIVKVVVGRNVIDHNLEWVREEDVSLRVEAIQVSKSNELRKVEVGDPEGEKRTLYFYGLADGESLKERAGQELLKFKREGFKGNVRTFLVPFISIGNVLRLSDENFDNNEGDYLAERVVTTISDAGGRRVTDVGLKLDA